MRPPTFFQLAAAGSPNLRNLQCVPTKAPDEPPGFTGSGGDVWLHWPLAEQWRAAKAIFERDCTNAYRDGNGEIVLLHERRNVTVSKEHPWGREFGDYPLSRWAPEANSTLESWRLSHASFKDILNEYGEPEMERRDNSPDEGCRWFALLVQLMSFRDATLLANRQVIRGTHRHPTNEICEMFRDRRNELLVPDLDEIIVLNGDTPIARTLAQARLRELAPEHRKPGYHKAIKTIVYAGKLGNYDAGWERSGPNAYDSAGVICFEPELEGLDDVGVGPGAILRSTCNG